MGMRLALDQHAGQAARLATKLASKIGDKLVAELLEADMSDEAGIIEQRKRVETMRSKISKIKTQDATRLRQLADYLVRKNVWIFGGDGWAYDIGYGGLDHVLASGQDVNILVMDTEVYSNTGGQQSKATAMGAAAKFATAGKLLPKKDLGLMTMAYGNVYVASCAYGARDIQTVNAIKEAESYDGVSMVIAYSPCIEHGYELSESLGQMELAVQSGYWPLYRFDPRRFESGEKPLKIDSKPPTISLTDYLLTENRFAMVERRDPERFAKLVAAAEYNLRKRHAVYDKMAELCLPIEGEEDEGEADGDAGDTLAE